MTDELIKIHFIASATNFYTLCHSALVTKFLRVVNIVPLLLLSIHNLLVCCGEIEIASGPKCLLLLFFHWNLNGFTALIINKLSLLQAYIVQYHLVIVCLSETFLNSFFEIDNDDNLKNYGYNLIGSDYPSNLKSYKEYICLVKRDYPSTVTNKVLDLFK